MWIEPETVDAFGVAQAGATSYPRPYWLVHWNLGVDKTTPGALRERSGARFRRLRPTFGAVLP